MSQKCAVIGAGAWGTTLAILLAEKKNDVTLWVYEKELVQQITELRENKLFLPGFPLPENIEITGDEKTAAGSQILIFAVPTQFLAATARRFAGFINQESVLVAASKGIEQETLKLPLDILAEKLSTNNKLVALSGPNLSKEIAQGLPAASVAASTDQRLATMVQEVLMQERFRVYVNGDPLGVQLGGALKNVIAIAAGVADGLQLGNNAKAALLIRGFSEISRLGVAMGAKAQTFAGLSGMGDLITTCGSSLSRNHHVGEELAKGKKLNDILAGMKEVAEGVSTSKAAQALGKKYQVNMPVTDEVVKVLFERKTPNQSITDLMTRLPAQE
jgi:glycerol-3-phosphate dehydrogenase (NAD(P)+)